MKLDFSNDLFLCNPKMGTHGHVPVLTIITKLYQNCSDVWLYAEVRSCVTRLLKKREVYVRSH